MNYHNQFLTWPGYHREEVWGLQTRGAWIDVVPPKRTADRLRRGLRPRDRGRVMALEFALSGAVAVVLLVYLVRALLRPEHF